MADSRIVEELQRIVGRENVLFAKEDVAPYQSDESRRIYPPDYVVFPGSSQEVSEIMRLANSERIPVVPRGAGTGLTGGALPVRGGIVMVLTRMNRILEIDRENLIAVVEPGVITDALHRAVREVGLFYPPDPASSETCTIGGNVAECAGGVKTIKYGVTRDYVAGMEVVLPTGEIVSFGGKMRKDVVGYDLARLITGSEGTLGIATKLFLRLIPLPEGVSTFLALFLDLMNAARMVTDLAGAGITPAAVEFMDHSAVRLVRDYLKLGPSQAMEYFMVDAGERSALVLIELDGERALLKEQGDRIMDVCRANCVGAIKTAPTEPIRDRVWRIRKSTQNAIAASCAVEVSEDISVPRSRIPETVDRIRELEVKYDIQTANFGHLGDGNMHVNFLTGDGNPELMGRVHRAVEELFKITLELGGTISGEHGVGVTKAPYIEMEMGRDTIELMRRIKRAFDPNNILNPGKMGLDE
ncbi:MAG: FAD-binding oxidoreductase [bacterium]